MRFYLNKAFALIALLLLAFPALAQELTGRVVGVADGDTVTVLTETDGAKKQIKVRLNGIDAPESAQPFGQAAKQFASKAVFDKSVTVKVQGQDKYGRTLGIVIGPDGRNLNHALVKNGYAWWYRKYAPGDATLKQLEFEARQAKIGIWSEPKTAIAPWDWRRGKRPAPAPRPIVRRTPVEEMPGYETPVTGQVYITRTGGKYHRDGCQYLRRSQIPISLKDAESQGYGACSRCF